MSTWMLLIPALLANAQGRRQFPAREGQIFGNPFNLRCGQSARFEQLPAYFGAFLEVANPGMFIPQPIETGQFNQRFRPLRAFIIGLQIATRYDFRAEIQIPCGCGQNSSRAVPIIRRGVAANAGE
jgi:hypothetical protein